MTWEALQSTAIGLSEAPSDGVLADVLDARRRGAAWLEAEHLVAAAQSIVDHARRSGATDLFAASCGGFCAVGVALTLDPDLRLYEYGRATDVLVVDLAVASTTGIWTLAQRLRETGAGTVTTLVLDDEPAAATSLPRLAAMS